MSEFQSYIGIKLIKAKPATFGELNVSFGNKRC